MKRMKHSEGKGMRAKSDNISAYLLELPTPSFDQVMYRLFSSDPIGPEGLSEVRL